MSLVARAAAGDLDSSFGTNGKVITSFSAVNDEIWDIAVQADGKIVAVGKIGFQPGAGMSSFGVARFNENGTLDQTFGKGGWVATNFSVGFAEATTLAIQPDGKIVVCGTGFSPDALATSFIALARYLPNGSLDTSFDGDGKVETSFGTYGGANSVAIQADGKIVIAGSVSGNFAVVRYRSDGSRDKSFGYLGKVNIAVSPRWDEATGIRIQPDGKIVVGGTTGLANGWYAFAVARLNLDGRLDHTFDTDGIQRTQFWTRDFAYDLDLQTDGKIVLAGITDTGGSLGSYAIARYNPNGSLDTTFDGDGKAVTDSGAYQGMAYDIAVQQDGKILVGGHIRELASPAYTDFMIVRYNADGTMDSGFGTGGKVKVIMSDKYDEITALAIQTNGRIIAAGVSVNDALKSEFALARLFAN